MRLIAAAGGLRAPGRVNPELVRDLCGNQPERHRADAGMETTSRRWRGTSTPSSRFSYGDDVASMAWGVRNLISAQEPTDDEIEAELNTMLGAPAAAAALADVKQEA